MYTVLYKYMNLATYVYKDAYSYSYKYNVTIDSHYSYIAARYLPSLATWLQVLADHFDYNHCVSSYHISNC